MISDYILTMMQEIQVANDSVPLSMAEKMATLWIAAETPGAVIRLFLNNYQPNPAIDTLSSFTECSGSWYNPISAVYFPVAIAPATNDVVVTCQTEAWTYSGTAAAQTVYGWFITNTISSVNTLLHSGLLSSPVVMQTSGNQVIASPGFNMSEIV